MSKEYIIIKIKDEWVFKRNDISNTHETFRFNTKYKAFEFVKRFRNNKKYGSKVAKIIMQSDFNQDGEIL